VLFFSHIVPGFFYATVAILHFVFYVRQTVQDYREISFKSNFRKRVHRKWIPTTTSTWLARSPNIPSFNWREWKTNT